jgi:hypothetical protein
MPSPQQPQYPNASENVPLEIQFAIEALRTQWASLMASSYSSRDQAEPHCLALSTYAAAHPSVPDSTKGPMYATGPQSDWSWFLQLADYDSNSKLGLKVGLPPRSRDWPWQSAFPISPRWS